MATQTTPKKTKNPTPPTKRRRARGVHDARMNFRINSEHKERIEFAAFEAGQTVSEFAAAALLEKADAVMEKKRVTRLDEEDWERFVEAITNPQPLPESALAIARHMGKYTRQTEKGIEFLPGYVENFPDWVKEGPF